MTKEKLYLLASDFDSLWKFELVSLFHFYCLLFIGAVQGVMHYDTNLPVSVRGGLKG